MNILVKQLKHQGSAIAPQTIAEAVLVKQGSSVITLDKALELKQNTIITPDDSGLTQNYQNNTVILTHSNNIEANEKPQALLIKYDSHGHITETVPTGKTTISVQNTTVIESNNLEDQNLNFTDDFEIVDKNNIKLKFNNL